jgi:hypothetical protein
MAKTTLRELTPLCLAGAIAMCVVSSAAAQPAPPGPHAPPTASADCLQAFEAAQTLRDHATPLAARRALVECGQAHCPAAVIGQCTKWLDEVDKEIPSIVLVTTDQDGHDVLDVQVTADGEPLSGQLHGRELQLEPGPHVLRFERTGSEPIERQIVLRVGEQRRKVEVQFGVATKVASAPAAPDEADGFTPSALFWVGVAVTGAGLVVGTAAGFAAVARQSDLEQQCATSGCAQQEIDDGALVAHVSTGGFALAGAGAIVAIVGLLTSGSADDDMDAHQGARVDLSVTPFGVLAHGAF